MIRFRNVFTPHYSFFFFDDIWTFSTNTKKILLQGTTTNKKYRYKITVKNEPQLPPPPTANLPPCLRANL